MPSESSRSAPPASNSRCIRSTSSLSPTPPCALASPRPSSWRIAPERLRREFTRIFHTVGPADAPFIIILQDGLVKLPVVAVVGRPNVGKSTLFNRVLGQRLAIVEDWPGVTRDRNFARAEWNGRQFYLVDTGGMVEGSDEPMDRLIRDQVLTAIGEADVLVLVVDGKAGPHPLDYAVAEHLRRTAKPTLLVVNKV